MGVRLHHAIIVSGKKSEIEQPHKKAIEIFGSELVTSILRSYTQEHYTFFIGPDGSKDGNDISNTNDINRSNFLYYMHSLKDSKIFLDFVEVSYGNDDQRAKVERASYRE